MAKPTKSDWTIAHQEADELVAEVIKRNEQYYHGIILNHIHGCVAELTRKVFLDHDEKEIQKLIVETINNIVYEKFSDSLKEAAEKYVKSWHTSEIREKIEKEFSDTIQNMKIVFK